MSYALRNTLILLFFFLLLAGGGISYIYFVQNSQIEELEEDLAANRAEYNELSAIADNYPFVQQAVESAEEFIENYDKSLFPTHQPDQIYKFLSEINFTWPRVEFNFNFTDSSNVEQYGIITSSVSGLGSYRAIYNFINHIENSMPVQKIRNLQISPINQVGEYGNANFTFDIDSYYDRSNYFDTEEEDLFMAMSEPVMFHNPFFPLIRDIEPNEDNLTDVENSRLIGLSNSRIFLRNQQGELVNLMEGDQVYLGNLRNINVQTGTATFRLNKGGIIEDVTLEVRR
jgi:hypothetical protein